MSYYKCGHDREPVFIKKSIVEYQLYLFWKEHYEFDDEQICFECFGNRLKEK